MRLSLDPKDRGYRPPAELAQFRVFFNGVERKDCYTADEEEGYIRTVRQNRPAPWLPLSTKVGVILRGKVEIKPR